MPKTFIEQRPTCVSVIGWAWIVLGAGMCLSGTMALVVSTILLNEAPPAPVSAQLFPYLALIQICIALIGFISGINFLKLKAWSRRVLEALSWFFLVLCAGFMFFWEYMWITQVPAGSEPEAFKWLGAVMGLVISCIYVVPLVIMLKYLRGEKVRNALRDDREFPSLVE